MRPVWWPEASMPSGYGCGAGMLELVRQLRDILEPAARKKLVVAMVGSVLLASLDTLAIALVLPLVDIASGKGIDSGPASIAANVIGSDDAQQVTAVLAVVVVTLFVVEEHRGAAVQLVAARFRLLRAGRRPRRGSWASI